MFKYIYFTCFHFVSIFKCFKKNLIVKLFGWMDDRTDNELRRMDGKDDHHGQRVPVTFGHCEVCQFIKLYLFQKNILF
jgi:hypothetical protein